MRSKSHFFALLSALTLVSLAGASLVFSSDSGDVRGGSCAGKKPWIYFDLGKVLVDTSDWSKLRYIEGAQDYVHQLKDHGYSIGLIVNIPEAWGKDQAEKRAALVKFIADSWVEPKEFEWDLFETIILPNDNSERKPAPVMFERALRNAQDCAIYEGENVTEVEEAARLGMKAYWVGAPDKEFFLPVDKIPAFVE